VFGHDRVALLLAPGADHGLEVVTEDRIQHPGVPSSSLPKDGRG
jgi:hypothetical protein